jgi:hypothetical protein
VEEIKPGMLYTAEQLDRIYRQMLPGGLLIPVIQEVGPSPAVGPRFMVFRLHSELGLEPAEYHSINLQLLSLAFSPMPARRRPKFVFCSTPRKYSPRPAFIKDSWNSSLKRGHRHSMSSGVSLVRGPSFRKPPSRMN